VHSPPFPDTARETLHRCAHRKTPWNGFKQLLLATCFRALRFPFSSCRPSPHAATFRSPCSAPHSRSLRRPLPLAPPTPGSTSLRPTTPPPASACSTFVIRTGRRRPRLRFPTRWPILPRRLRSPGPLLGRQRSFTPRQNSRTARTRSASPRSLRRQPRPRPRLALRSRRHAQTRTRPSRRRDRTCHEARGHLRPLLHLFSAPAEPRADHPWLKAYNGEPHPFLRIESNLELGHIVLVALDERLLTKAAACSTRSCPRNAPPASRPTTPKAD